MNTTVSSENFYYNFLELKEKMRTPLPTDKVILQCDQCREIVTLNNSGVIRVDAMLEKEISYVLDYKIQTMIKTHGQERSKCLSANMIIHPILGSPANVIVSMQESETKYINCFKIGIASYSVDVIIRRLDMDNKAIFVLYKKVDSIDETYSDFIRYNINNFLNNIWSIEELIDDDESVNKYQQILPRVIGGGRKLRAEFNYVCLWCPKEDIKKGQLGKFKELKNYRDHFRKKHQGEDGKGVPMSQFLEKVKRVEPTWFCKNCKQHQSIGNVVRHKAICNPEEDAETGDIDDEGCDREGQQENILTNEKNRPQSSFHRSGKEHNSNETDIDSQDNSEIILTPHEFESSDSLITDRIQSLDPIPSVNHIRMKLTKSPFGQYEVVNIEDNEKDQQMSKKRKENSGVELEAKLLRSRENKQTRKVNLSDDNVEELNSNKNQNHQDESGQSDEQEIKVEVLDEVDNLIDESNKNNEEINKWWQKCQQNIYTNKGLAGPKIFLPTDSVEFINSVSETFKKHQSDKVDLDRQRIEIEEGEAQFLQFSEKRDKLILDKYTTYVHKFSAKESLNLFAEDYELLDIPTGLKSTTAKQYTNRIVEFFKFMASIYHNFHLDWMVDFQGTIEKTYPDGQINNHIFLPTKNDLLDFVKQFKYGSNPAANCGLRIFAIKKLMDFLSQEIKDNENAFMGNMIEKSKTVECLVKKIKNLNEGICPDGTIKHLATASNKSHKRTLMEQLTKYPERNMNSIMTGVQEYINSDEFANQRTTLIELACKSTRIPTINEYSNSTNWLLEQLICIGGNRPCALLGITLRDWAEKKPGYCPFNQDDENEMQEEEPGCDNRKVLKNPYIKPKGSMYDQPTGYIVKSETDKIAVGPPCYIWFPSDLVNLVNDHSLIAQKILPRSVDIYHPKTRLFLNSNGKPITRIECKHFKSYIGIPVTAYDFRRSLSTFCLDSNDDNVKKAESSVLRHREETGYAYYFQKHGERVEYVNIQYAMSHGLIKADNQSVDEYCDKLRKGAANLEWELNQKRTDKALEYSQEIMKKRREGLNNAKQKGGRNWILPQEYDAFIEGIEEAIRMEETRVKEGLTPGPFCQLLQYRPGIEGAGIFPPTGIWHIDMCRVLYGLKGTKGDLMRKADLSVYDGIPFVSGLSGRKKIALAMEKTGVSSKEEHIVIANYWRDKIRDESIKANSEWKMAPHKVHIHTEGISFFQGTN